MTRKFESRIETDRQGQIEVPAGALWGAQTARAIQSLNFRAFSPGLRLTRALVMVKKAAAAANASTGRLEAAKKSAIMQAADEMLNGQWLDQIVVNPFQSGSGQAHNTNINEVLANRAIEILGGERGSYDIISPVRDVNLAQSANDVFPTAMRLAILEAAAELKPVLLDLERLLRRKSLEFNKVVKTGRTHLQDSLPVSLGQEFNAYGSSIEKSYNRLADVTSGLYELNLGATAVGTGLNAEPAYIAHAVKMLAEMTGQPLRTGADYFRLTQSMADFAAVSSALKELSIELSKIANDLKLMYSGPLAGLAEIVLPVFQPEPSLFGPEVLPDSLNPVLPDVVNMVAFRVIGNDAAVTMAAHAGQLELNTMMPVIAHSILESIDLLIPSLESFNNHCLQGIKASEDRCKELMELTTVIAASLGSHIGYEKAASLASESMKTGKTVRQLVLEKELMSPELLDRALHYKALISPGIPGITDGDSV